MSLKLATFPVTEAAFGTRTGWENGRLTLDRSELEDLVRRDSRVANVSIDIASPGDSARIIHVVDVIEPRVKVDGPGMTYPGVCDRPVDTVGTGTTHRLGGLSVVESAGGQESGVGTTRTAREAREVPQNPRPHNFIEMSGPGAVISYASLINVCVSVDTVEGIGDEDEHLVTHGAALLVSDRLAQATVGLQPPEVEEIDSAQPGSSLPGIVFICNLLCMEIRRGPDSKIGTAVYGVTRLSAPWLLTPEEMLDGAVSQQISWHFTNNPIVRELLDRHGTEVNFLGCIIQRTNWGGQDEMQLSSNRSAQIASKLGAEGAIITTNRRGRRFVDTVLGIKACEDAGIKAVLTTEEEDDENGTTSPLLVYTSEMKAVVSTGTSAVPGPFRPVERVLGAREGDEDWAGELPPIPGRYGANHVQDYYGFGKQSREDY